MEILVLRVGFSMESISCFGESFSDLRYDFWYANSVPGVRVGCSPCRSTTGKVLLISRLSVSYANMRMLHNAFSAKRYVTLSDLDNAFHVCIFCIPAFDTLGPGWCLAILAGHMVISNAFAGHSSSPQLHAE